MIYPKVLQPRINAVFIKKNTSDVQPLGEISTWFIKNNPTREGGVMHGELAFVVTTYRAVVAIRNGFIVGIFDEIFFGAYDFLPCLNYFDVT